jgi:hypothetical protein
MPKQTITKKFKNLKLTDVKNLNITLCNDITGEKSILTKIKPKPKSGKGWGRY